MELAFQQRHAHVGNRVTSDDALLQRNVLKRISHYAPAAVIYLLAPLALQGYDSASRFVTQLVLIYMIVLGLLVLDAVLNAIVDVYRSQERTRYIPIRSFIQVIKLVASAIRTPDGDYALTVAPTPLPADHPLARLSGQQMGIVYHTDIYGTISAAILEEEPVPSAAAMLRDLLSIYT